MTYEPEAVSSKSLSVGTTRHTNSKLDVFGKHNIDLWICQTFTKYLAYAYNR